ncbi:MAG: hypothetical protein ACFFA5_00395 [Promethearchaeota archaeon]
MEQDFVTVKGEKYYFKDGKLVLSSKEITDISEIKDWRLLPTLKS